MREVKMKIKMKMKTKMKYIKTYESFSDEIVIKQNSNFTKEDMQEFYDEFQIIAESFNLKNVQQLDPDDEVNQYHIDVFKNAFIELLIFKDSEDIIDEIKSFIEKTKHFGWKLLNDINIEDYVEYKEVTVVFTKKMEVLKESDIKDPTSMIVGQTYKITYPCYDDYDEGLEPEIEIAEVIKKDNSGILLKDIENKFSHHTSYQILSDCTIENHEVL